MNESEISRLTELRGKLLPLHKALVDFERSQYEKIHGKLSNNQFLQLLISNDHFAWLRFFSEMIVEIDEMLDSKTPVSQERALTVLTNARKLLEPASIGQVFDERYREALQNDPTIVMAHQEVRKLLK